MASFQVVLWLDKKIHGTFLNLAESYKRCFAEMIFNMIILERYNCLNGYFIIFKLLLNVAAVFGIFEI